MDARVKDSAETSFKLRETLEFNSIALKIKSAELLEMTKKNSDLQSDLQLVEASKLALEGEALCLRSTLGSVEAERDEALKAAEELEQKLSQALLDSQSQDATSQEQLDKVKAKLLETIEKNAGLQSELKALESAKQALEGEASCLRSTLGSVESERDEALKAAEELKQSLEQALGGKEAAQFELSTGLNDIQNQLAEQREVCTSLSSSIEHRIRESLNIPDDGLVSTTDSTPSRLIPSLELKPKEAADDLERLKREFSEALKVNSQTQKNSAQALLLLETLENNVNLKTELSNLEERYVALRCEASCLRTTVAELHRFESTHLDLGFETIMKLEKELKFLRDDLATASNEIVSKNEMTRKLEDEVNDLKAQLSKIEVSSLNDQLSGISKMVVTMEIEKHEALKALEMRNQSLEEALNTIKGLEGDSVATMAAMCLLESKLKKRCSRSTEGSNMYEGSNLFDATREDEDELSQLNHQPVSAISMSLQERIHIATLSIEQLQSAYDCLAATRQLAASSSTIIKPKLAPECASLSPPVASTQSGLGSGLAPTQQIPRRLAMQGPFTLMSAMDPTVSRLEQLVHELSSTRETVTKLEISLRVTESELDKKVSQCTSLETELTRLRADLHEEMAFGKVFLEAKQLKEQLSSAEINAKSEEIVELEREIKQLKEQLSSAEMNAKSEVKELELEVKQLKEQLVALECISRSEIVDFLSETDLFLEEAKKNFEDMKRERSHVDVSFVSKPGNNPRIFRKQAVLETIYISAVGHHDVLGYESQIRMSHLQSDLNASESKVLTLLRDKIVHMDLLQEAEAKVQDLAGALAQTRSQCEESKLEISNLRSALDRADNSSREDMIKFLSDTQSFLQAAQADFNQLQNSRTHIDSFFDEETREKGALIFSPHSTLSPLSSGRMFDCASSSSPSERATQQIKLSPDPIRNSQNGTVKFLFHPYQEDADGLRDIGGIGGIGGMDEKYSLESFSLLSPISTISKTELFIQSEELSDVRTLNVVLTAELEAARSELREKQV